MDVTNNGGYHFQYYYPQDPNNVLGDPDYGEWVKPCVTFEYHRIPGSIENYAQWYSEQLYALTATNTMSMVSRFVHAPVSAYDDTFRMVAKAYERPYSQGTYGSPLACPAASASTNYSEPPTELNNWPNPWIIDWIDAYPHFCVDGLITPSEPIAFSFANLNVSDSCGSDVTVNFTTNGGGYVDSTTQNWEDPCLTFEFRPTYSSYLNSFANLYFSGATTAQTYTEDGINGTTFTMWSEIPSPMMSFLNNGTPMEFRAHAYERPVNGICPDPSVSTSWQSPPTELGALVTSTNWVTSNYCQ